MPIYERNGAFRVTVYSNGKQSERVVRGPRELAELAEVQMRSDLGVKQKLDYEEMLKERDVIWLGGAKSYVYFVQAGETGPIKIGFTANSVLRLAAIQVGCPEKIRLLAVMPGGRQLEVALHEAFHHARVRADGEWFKPIKRLLRLVDETKALQKLCDDFGGTH